MKSSGRVLCWVLTVVAALQAAAQVQVPGGAVATRDQVSLNWSQSSTPGGHYMVERINQRIAETRRFAVEGESFIDRDIDPRATYSYRVRAVGSLRIALAATVGPPLDGFNLVSAAPNQSDNSGYYGFTTRMALDANRDPLIVFGWGNPGGNGDFSDAAIYFTAWNRSQSAFTKAVKVAVTGDITPDGVDPERPFSIAYDAITGTIGIAYRVETPNPGVYLALSSDGGQTWPAQIVATRNDGGDYYSPSLALADGNVFLAYGSDQANSNSGRGIVYMTGREGSLPTSWQPQLAAYSANADSAERAVSLALDGDGNPGVAYILDANDGSEQFLSFWRPGGELNTAATTNGQITQDPDIKLSFYHTEPRLAYLGAVNTTVYADSDHQLWALESANGGTAWTVPANIPGDNEGLANPIWLATGSAGQSAVVSVHGGGYGTNLYSDPPLSFSDDNFTNWQTIGPLMAGQAGSNYDAQSPVVLFGPADRLLLAFAQTETGADLAYGVYLWAQPQSPTTAPQINSGGVVQGATFTANVSAGSLASIFGLNFLSQATGAAYPLPLPTSLTDSANNVLSVTVNEVPAPLVFANQSQINFQVPWETPLGASTVVVTVNGVESNGVVLNATAAAPGIFTYASNAVAQDTGYNLIGPANPAKPGGAIIVYLTGSGPVNPPVADGAAAPSSSLSRVQSPVTATVGTTPAQVLFAGLSPGFAGLLQVDLIVPSSLAAGTYPVTIFISGEASNSPNLVVGP